MLNTRLANLMLEYNSCKPCGTMTWYTSVGVGVVYFGNGSMKDYCSN